MTIDEATPSAPAENFFVYPCVSVNVTMNHSSPNETPSGLHSSTPGQNRVDVHNDQTRTPNSHNEQNGYQNMMWNNPAMTFQAMQQMMAQQQLQLNLQHHLQQQLEQNHQLGLPWPQQPIMPKTIISPEKQEVTFHQPIFVPSQQSSKRSSLNLTCEIFPSPVCSEQSSDDSPFPSKDAIFAGENQFELKPLFNLQEVQNQMRGGEEMNQCMHVIEEALKDPSLAEAGKVLLKAMSASSSYMNDLLQTKKRLSPPLTTSNPTEPEKLSEKLFFLSSSIDSRQNNGSESSNEVSKQPQNQPQAEVTTSAGGHVMSQSQFVSQGHRPQQSHVPTANNNDEQYIADNSASLFSGQLSLQQGQSGENVANLTQFFQQNPALFSSQASLMQGQSNIADSHQAASSNAVRVQLQNSSSLQQQGTAPAPLYHQDQPQANRVQGQVVPSSSSGQVLAQTQYQQIHGANGSAFHLASQCRQLQATGNQPFLIPSSFPPQQLFRQPLPTYHNAVSQQQKQDPSIQQQVHQLCQGQQLQRTPQQQMQPPPQQQSPQPHEQQQVLQQQLQQQHFTQHYQHQLSHHHQLVQQSMQPQHFQQDPRQQPQIHQQAHPQPQQHSQTHHQVQPPQHLHHHQRVHNDKLSPTPTVSQAQLLVPVHVEPPPLQPKPTNATNRKQQSDVTDPSTPVLSSRPSPTLDTSPSIRTDKPKVHKASCGHVEKANKTKPPTAAFEGSPHKYLLCILKDRGYSTETTSAQDAGYSSTPTALQLASFGTALVQAADKHDAQALANLLACGLSPNPCNQFGDSILGLVCKRADYDIFKVLVDHGCDLQVADSFGRTTLHNIAWASKFCPEMAKVVFDYDLNQVLIQDKRGQCPLEYVRKEHWYAWKDFLRQHMDSYWPLKHDDRRPRRPLPRGRGPVADPSSAVSPELAVQLASGQVTPEEAVRIKNQGSALLQF